MTTTPRTWVVGEVVTAALMNQEIRDQFDDILDTWTAYTPTWAATGTAVSLGNGTIAGRYKLVGKKCTAIVDQVMNTTTTFGTGTYSWSLPFTAANPGSTSVNFIYAGTARSHNASAWWSGTAGVTKNTSVIRAYSHNAATEWSPSQPFTWTNATTNYLNLQVEFEVA